MTPSARQPPPPPRPVPLNAISWGIRFVLLFAGIWFAVSAPITAVFAMVEIASPESVFPLFVILLMGGLSLVSGAGVAWAARVAMRQRKVYRNGKVCAAEVQELRSTGSSQNNRPVVKAVYEFRVGAKRCSGAWSTVGPPRIGTWIWVIYDSSDPEKNVAVPAKYAAPAKKIAAAPAKQKHPHQLY